MGILLAASVPLLMSIGLLLFLFQRNIPLLLTRAANGASPDFTVTIGSGRFGWGRLFVGDITVISNKRLKTSSSSSSSSSKRQSTKSSNSPPSSSKSQTDSQVPLLYCRLGLFEIQTHVLSYIASGLRERLLTIHLREPRVIVQNPPNDPSDPPSSSTQTSTTSSTHPPQPTIPRVSSSDSLSGLRRRHRRATGGSETAEDDSLQLPSNTTSNASSQSSSSPSPLPSSSSPTSSGERVRDAVVHLLIAIASKTGGTLQRIIRGFVRGLEFSIEDVRVEVNQGVLSLCAHHEGFTFSADTSEQDSLSLHAHWSCASAALVPSSSPRVFPPTKIDPISGDSPRAAFMNVLFPGTEVTSPVYPLLEPSAGQRFLELLPTHAQLVVPLVTNPQPSALIVTCDGIHGFINDELVSQLKRLPTPPPPRPSGFSGPAVPTDSSDQDPPVVKIPSTAWSWAPVHTEVTISSLKASGQRPDLSAPMSLLAAEVLFEVNLHHASDYTSLEFGLELTGPFVSTDDSRYPQASSVVSCARTSFTGTVFGEVSANPSPVVGGRRVSLQDPSTTKPSSVVHFLVSSVSIQYSMDTLETNISPLVLGWIQWLLALKDKAADRSRALEPSISLASLKSGFDSNPSSTPSTPSAATASQLAQDSGQDSSSSPTMSLHRLPLIVSILISDTKIFVYGAGDSPLCALTSDKTYGVVHNDNSVDREAVFEDFGSGTTANETGALSPLVYRGGAATTPRPDTPRSARHARKLSVSDPFIAATRARSPSRGGLSTPRTPRRPSDQDRSTSGVEATATFWTITCQVANVSGLLLKATPDNPNETPVTASATDPSAPPGWAPPEHVRGRFFHLGTASVTSSYKIKARTFQDASVDADTLALECSPHLLTTAASILEAHQTEARVVGLLSSTPPRSSASATSSLASTPRVNKLRSSQSLSGGLKASLASSPASSDSDSDLPDSISDSTMGASSARVPSLALDQLSQRSLPSADTKSQDSDSAAPASLPTDLAVHVDLKNATIYVVDALDEDSGSKVVLRLQSDIISANYAPRVSSLSLQITSTSFHHFAAPGPDPTSNAQGPTAVPRLPDEAKSQPVLLIQTIRLTTLLPMAWDSPISHPRLNIGEVSAFWTPEVQMGLFALGVSLKTSLSRVQEVMAAARDGPYSKESLLAEFGLASPATSKDLGGGFARSASAPASAFASQTRASPSASPRSALGASPGTGRRSAVWNRSSTPVTGERSGSTGPQSRRSAGWKKDNSLVGRGGWSFANEALFVEVSINHVSVKAVFSAALTTTLYVDRVRVNQSGKPPLQVAANLGEVAFNGTPWLHWSSLKITPTDCKGWKSDVHAKWPETRKEDYLFYSGIQGVSSSSTARGKRSSLGGGAGGGSNSTSTSSPAGANARSPRNNKMGSFPSPPVAPVASTAGRPPRPTHVRKPSGSSASAARHVRSPSLGSDGASSMDDEPDDSGLDLVSKGIILDFDELRFALAPEPFDFGVALEDLLSVVKALQLSLKSMNDAVATKPKATSNKPRPAATTPLGGVVERLNFVIRGRSVVFDLEDDPMSVKLAEIFALGRDEAVQRDVRRETLDEKIAERANHGQALSRVQVDTLHEQLDIQGARIYAKRVNSIRAALSRRTHLFRVKLDAVSITLVETGMLKGQALHEALAALDSSPTRPTEWEDIMGRYCYVWARGLAVQLRDYPLPLVSMERLKASGPIILAEADVRAHATVNRQVWVGGAAGVVSVPRTLASMKTYHNLDAVVSELLVSFGNAYEPVLSDLSPAFDRLTPASADPSPVQAWFDKMRMLLHGRLFADIRGMKVMLLKAALDPYDVHEYLEIAAQRLRGELFNGGLNLDAEWLTLIQAPHDANAGYILDLPRARGGLEFHWVTLGDPYSHYLIPNAPSIPKHMLKNLAFPPPDFDRSVDTFRKWRSSGLDLRISLHLSEAVRRDQAGPRRRRPRRRRSTRGRTRRRNRSRQPSVATSDDGNGTGTGTEGAVSDEAIREGEERDDDSSGGGERGVWSEDEEGWWWWGSDDDGGDRSAETGRGRDGGDDLDDDMDLDEDEEVVYPSICFDPSNARWLVAFGESFGGPKLTTVFGTSLPVVTPPKFPLGDHIQGLHLDLTADNPAVWMWQGSGHDQIGMVWGFDELDMEMDMTQKPEPVPGSTKTKLGWTLDDLAVDCGMVKTTMYTPKGAKSFYASDAALRAARPYYKRSGYTGDVFLAAPLLSVRKQGAGTKDRPLLESPAELGNEESVALVRRRRDHAGDNGLYVANAAADDDVDAVDDDDVDINALPRRGSQSGSVGRRASASSQGSGGLLQRSTSETRERSSTWWIGAMGAPAPASLKDSPSLSSKLNRTSSGSNFGGAFADSMRGVGRRGPDWGLVRSTSRTRGLSLGSNASRPELGPNRATQSLARESWGVGRRSRAWRGSVMGVSDWMTLDLILEAPRAAPGRFADVPACAPLNLATPYPDVAAEMDEEDVKQVKKGLFGHKAFTWNSGADEAPKSAAVDGSQVPDLAAEFGVRVTAHRAQMRWTEDVRDAVFQWVDVWDAWKERRQRQEQLRQLARQAAVELIAAADESGSVARGAANGTPISPLMLADQGTDESTRRGSGDLASLSARVGPGGTIISRRPSMQLGAAKALERSMSNDELTESPSLDDISIGHHDLGAASMGTSGSDGDGGNGMRRNLSAGTLDLEKAVGGGNRVNEPAVGSAEAEMLRKLMSDEFQSKKVELDQGSESTSGDASNGLEEKRGLFQPPPSAEKVWFLDLVFPQICAVTDAEQGVVVLIGDRAYVEGTRQMLNQASSAGRERGRRVAGLQRFASELENVLLSGGTTPSDSNGVSAEDRELLDALDGYGNVMKDKIGKGPRGPRRARESEGGPRLVSALDSSGLDHHEDSLPIGGRGDDEREVPPIEKAVIRVSVERLTAFACPIELYLDNDQEWVPLQHRRDDHPSPDLRRLAKPGCIVVAVTAYEGTDGGMAEYFETLTEEEQNQFCTVIALWIPMLRISLDSKEFSVFFECIKALVLTRPPRQSALDDRVTELLFRSQLAPSKVEEVESTRAEWLSLRSEIQGLEAFEVFLSAQAAGNQDIAVELMRVKDELRDLRKRYAEAEDELGVLADSALAEKGGYVKGLLATNYSIDWSQWNLVDDDGTRFAMGFVDRLHGDSLTREDESGGFSVELHRLTLSSTPEGGGATSTELLAMLSPDDPSYERRAMLRVFAKEGTPVGGIKVFDHFEVNLVPVRVNLTSAMIRKLKTFLLPESETDVSKKLMGSTGSGSKSGGSMMLTMPSANPSIVVSTPASPKSPNKAVENVVSIPVPTLVKSGDRDGERKGAFQARAPTTREIRIVPLDAYQKTRLVEAFGPRMDLSTYEEEEDESEGGEDSLRVRRSSKKSSAADLLSDNGLGGGGGGGGGGAGGGAAAADLATMQHRAKENVGMLYFKVPPVHAVLSFSGDKASALMNVTGLDITFDTIEYSSKTWSWADLAEDVSKRLAGFLLVHAPRYLAAKRGGAGADAAAGMLTPEQRTRKTIKKAQGEESSLQSPLFDRRGSDGGPGESGASINPDVHAISGLGSAPGTPSGGARTKGITKLLSRFRVGGGGSNSPDPGGDEDGGDEKDSKDGGDKKNDGGDGAGGGGGGGADDALASMLLGKAGKKRGHRRMGSWGGAT